VQPTTEGADLDSPGTGGYVVRLHFAHIDPTNLLRVARAVHTGLGLAVPPTPATPSSGRWEVYSALHAGAR